MKARMLLAVAIALIVPTTYGAAKGGEILLPLVQPQPLMDMVPSKYRAAIVASDGSVYAIKIDSSIDKFSSTSLASAGYVLREKDPYSELAPGVDIVSSSDRVDTTTYFSSIDDSIGNGFIPGVDGLKPAAADINGSGCTDGELSGAFWVTGFGSVFTGSDVVAYRACSFPRYSCLIIYGLGVKGGVQATSAQYVGACYPNVTINGISSGPPLDSGKWRLLFRTQVAANLITVPLPDTTLRFIRAYGKPPTDPTPRSKISFGNIDYRQLIKTFALGRGVNRRLVKCFAVVHKKMVESSTYKTISYTDSGSDWFVGGDCETVKRTPVSEYSVPSGTLPDAAAQLGPMGNSRMLFDPTFTVWSANGEDTAVFIHPGSGRAWWFNWPEGVTVELPGWGGATPVTWHYGVYKAKR